MADGILRGKTAAAEAMAARVRPGMLVALGTGSTAEIAIRALGRRFPAEGAITTVASSAASGSLAEQLRLGPRLPHEGDRYDLMIDGADEVDPHLRLTKGGGGALLREKLLARHSRTMLIAVDESKVVRRLGERSPIPVEIVPFARPVLLYLLRERGLHPELRLNESGHARLTDNGNEILDLHPGTGVDDPVVLDRELHALTGVVETGLFVDLAPHVFVGHADGTVTERGAPVDGAPA